MELLVQSYMTRNPVSIAPDDTLSTAKARMEECGIRHLPVLEGTQVVGVISSRDLFLLDALKERLLYLIKVRDAALGGRDPHGGAPDRFGGRRRGHARARRLHGNRCAAGAGGSVEGRRSRLT